MADYSLGTAEGKIKIGYDGTGINQASKGLSELEKGSFRVRRSFQTIATTTGIAAGAIAAGIGFAVNAAIDFEKRISAIGAVSGATKDQLEVLRKKALQLGADTVFSASDAASAMEELAKAGLSVTDIMNGAADATVALAAAGEIDLPQAATIAANAMNQFNLAAKDLPRVADLIAGAANASAIDVSDFGLAMQQAGAVANLTGLKFEDLAVAIALMGNAGIRGSDAGTSLKTMLQNLIPTTKQQIILSKKLGLITKDGSNAFFDATGHVKSLADVAQILQKSLSGLTAEQKSLALQTLFGSDAIRAAAVLANAGAAGFDKLSTAMGKVTAADVAKQRMDNVAGSIEQLKGSVDSAAIAFGTVLLPTIRKVTDFITMLVNKFTALDPRWQKLIAFVAIAGAALLGFVSVIASVGAVIAGVAASTGALEIAALITGIVVALIALAAAVKVAYDHSKQFRDLVAKMGLVFKAVFSLILAVIKPIVAFIKTQLIPAAREIAATFMKNLQPAIKAIGDWIQNRALPAVQKLQAALVKAMPTILAIAKVLLTLAKIFFFVLGKALGFIIPLLLDLIGPIFSALITVIAAVISFIPRLVAGFMAVFNVLKVIGEIIAIAVIAPFYLIYQVGKFVFEQLMKVVNVFVDAFLAVWGFFAPVIEPVFKLIGSILAFWFDVFSTLFRVWWAVVTAIWNKIWDSVIGPTINALRVIGSAIKVALDFIVGIISASLAIARAIFEKVFGWIVPPMQAAFDFLKNLVMSSLTATWKIAQAIWTTIVAVFTRARDNLIAIVTRLSDFVAKVRSVFDQAKQAAVSKVQEIIDFVKGLPGKLQNALGNVGSMLFGAGKALIQGFWDGMKAIWNSMVGWLEGKMSSLRGLWPFSPAKWGPFSGKGWVLYSGRALMEGFAEGIDQRAAAVSDAAQRAMAGIAGQLPTDFSATVGTTTSGAGMAAGLSGTGVSAPTTATNNNSTTININVPLEDLSSIRDVQDLLDFIDRLRNDGRRGLVDA